MSLPRIALHRIVSAALVATACIGGALACGPFFPWQLFDDRADTVTTPVGVSFSFEISRLVATPRDTPRDTLRAVEPAPFDVPESEPIAAERREIAQDAWQPLLGGAQRSADELTLKLDAARRASDGKEAIEVGWGLPPAVLDYIAGALEFHAERYDSAARYFDEIETLPREQRRIRAVAAAYMQGRIYQRTGKADDARTAFLTARSQAEAGAPDPMGLAVASLGEEARIDLIEGRLADSPWPFTLPDVDYDKAISLIAHAVQLYAEQASHGSKIALSSLRDVASGLSGDPDFLAAAVAQPLLRRLLVAYVIARDDDYGGSLSDDPDAAAKVIDAVLTQPEPTGDDVDRLAALAYQTARYAVAEKLVASTTRPLGLWVRAKLALRRGDRTAAVRDWTAALTAFEGAASAPPLDAAAALRLRGETAVIHVSVGDYAESLRLLFPAARDYWGDVAYIAERVMTVEELKTFVDGLPSSSAPAPRSDNDMQLTDDPAGDLRDLLARRLMREGRTEEALAYFPTAKKPPAWHDTEPQTPIAEEAKTYRAALEAAKPGGWPWQKVSRAEALFKVAMLTRKRGLELSGTEGPPDEAALGGDFSGGVGQASPLGYTAPPPEGQPTYTTLDERAVKEREAVKALLGPDEEKRFAASAPKPDVRFHYRVIATDRALEAAALLPQRSQAYAATLCWATQFAFDSSDEKRANAIYRRYVATGAYQPKIKAFGRDCPDPDFNSARSFWQRQILAWPMRHKLMAAGALAVVMVLVAGTVWFVRRRRSLIPSA
jgi:tetratricopeptide (TPR) repeat protein